MIDPYPDMLFPDKFRETSLFIFLHKDDKNAMESTKN